MSANDGPVRVSYDTDTNQWSILPDAVTVKKKSTIVFKRAKGSVWKFVGFQLKDGPSAQFQVEGDPGDELKVLDLDSVAGTYAYKIGIQFGNDPAIWCDPKVVNVVE